MILTEHHLLLWRTWDFSRSYPYLDLRGCRSLRLPACFGLFWSFEVVAVVAPVVPLRYSIRLTDSFELYLELLPEPICC